MNEDYPKAYKDGKAEFYGREFMVSPDVLIPRPETAEMISKIVNSQHSTVNNHCSIIDIGTGSGCIAISLAKMISNSNVYALDISEEALKIAKENAFNNNVNVSFIHDDILNLKNNIETKL